LKNVSMNKEIKLNPLSFPPILLEANFEDSTIAIATGFIWKHEKDNFLVSNWHVMSGLDPKTHQPIDSFSSTPDRVRMWLHSKDHLNRAVQVELQLLNNQGRPLWKEHKIHGSKIDVAILKMPSLYDYRLFPINDFDFSDFTIEVTQDVFIIGFPKGISGGGIFPVWKRGSIASEPEIDIDNLPKLIIDSATREGMSGSPVIVQFTGYHQAISGQLTLNDWIGKGWGILGVYSGRYKSDEFEAQLGIVWKSRVIDEIIKNGVSPK
jgi:hypothetical protein